MPSGSAILIMGTNDFEQTKPETELTIPPSILKYLSPASKATQTTTATVNIAFCLRFIDFLRAFRSDFESDDFCFEKPSPKFCITTAAI